jgi:pimeloyl-ACP methyl ester carboxylesterase
VANDTQTIAMRHERSMVRRVVDGSSYRAGILFGDDALRMIDAPVLMVYGTADQTGDAGIWGAFTTALPNGSLELIDDAGHMPWFDDAGRVAALVDGFLARPPVEAMGPDPASASATRPPAPAVLS